MTRLITAALLAFGLATPAPARATDELTLLLDWFVNPNHAPIVLADALGYFEAAGLEVEVTAPSDPALPPMMVAAGRADLAVTYQPELHLQVDAGLPLRRVGTLIGTPLNCLMTRADSGIESMADLAGKSIGFSVAGVEKALLAALLAPEGLSLDDVTLYDVQFSLTPALLSGQVDAVIGAYRNYELTQMRAAGVEGRCLFIEEHGAPVYDELIYVAGAAMLADPAGRDAVLRFLRATERATQFMVNHPQEAWRLFAAAEPELDDAVTAEIFAGTLARFALRPAALDSGRYRAFADFMRAAGLIDAGQSVDAVAVDLTRAQ